MIKMNNSGVRKFIGKLMTDKSLWRAFSHLSL